MENEKRKTLKEILPDTLDESNLIERIALRAEAVKWVKHNNTGGFSFTIGYDGIITRYHKTKDKLNSIDLANLGGMIEFINFFNLTEEDLK